MQAKLKEAILLLKKANKKYEEQVRNENGLLIDDCAFYIKIVGKAWQNYLKAGGSPTMIN